SSKRVKLLSVLILLTAAALRIYQLGSESLWIDEGYSIRNIMLITVDNNLFGGIRPLYFFLMDAWLKLGMAKDEFLFRLPSAIFGIAGVWILYCLGRRLAGSRSALLASLFMAVSVLHINHSQEVRMYALTALL